jgi:hypothetical protein
MSLRSWSRGSLLASAMLCLPLQSAAVAQAQGNAADTEPAEPTHPARYLAAWSAGVPLRLNRHAELGQDRFGPAFTDALGGYVLPSKHRFRHGAGLGLSLNLGSDGGYTEPVRALGQWVVMPSYLLYWDAAPDLFALGQFGVPILIHGGPSVGAELGGTLGYRLLAGFGAFARAGLDVFGGVSSTLHSSFSLAAGLFLDYEVLP